MRWNAGGSRGGGSTPWSSMPWALVLTLATLMAPAALNGQSLAGRVVEGSSGSPISGALVELLSDDERQIAAALSSEDGRFLVTAPQMGVFAIRVRRLGYAPVLLDPLELVGTRELTVEMALAPIALEGITGTARPRCENGPGVGPETQVLWDLISGALAATSAAQEGDVLAFELHQFVRDMDIERTRILTEGVDQSRGTTPFLGPDADELEEKGYVEVLRGGMLSYYMPDPAVLVSDEFLDAHCFRVATTRDPRVVGLRFDATPARLNRRPRNTGSAYRAIFGREMVEVSGTLWVDRATGALQELEYIYEGFEDVNFAEHAGGYARFEQLAGGIWAVRQWWLRMPNLGVGPDEELEVQSVREAGGYLISATDSLGQDMLPEQRGGTVRGQIVEQDLRVPVAGVVARLSGSPWITRTAPDGSFRFENVPPGPYLVTWYTPRLDSIGVDPRFEPVQVSEGGEAQVTLQGPGLQGTLDHLCLGMQADPDLGVLRVRVTSPSGVLPQNQPVQLRSTDASFALERMNILRESTTIFCSVPTGIPLSVTAPPFEGVMGTVTLEPSGIQLIELEVAAGGR